MKNLFIIFIVLLLFIGMNAQDVKKSIDKEAPVEITDYRHSVFDSTAINVRMGWVAYLAGNEIDNKVVTTFSWYDDKEKLLASSVADTALVPAHTTIRVSGENVFDTNVAQKIKWLGVHIHYIKKD